MQMRDDNKAGNTACNVYILQASLLYHMRILFYSAIKDQGQYNYSQNNPVITKQFEAVFLQVSDKEFYSRQGHHKCYQAANQQYLHIVFYKYFGVGFVYIVQSFY